MQHNLNAKIYIYILDNSIFQLKTWFAPKCNQKFHHLWLLNQSNSSFNQRQILDSHSTAETHLN